MKDLSIIFEDDIEIIVRIASGNEVHDLVFKFSQPDDIQTLRVLQSIENPNELQALGEKYSDVDEDDAVLPSSNEINTIVATQEAVYKLMAELVIEAPMYDKSKFKSFLEYFGKLDKVIRREVYTEFMSVAIGGTDGGDTAKKFELFNNITTQQSEGNAL